MLEIVKYYPVSSSRKGGGNRLIPMKLLFRKVTPATDTRLPFPAHNPLYHNVARRANDSRYSVVFRETATFPTTDTPQGSSRGFFVRSRNTVYYYCYLVPFFFSFLFLSPPPPTQSSSSSETKSFEARFDRVSITIDSKRG